MQTFSDWIKDQGGCDEAVTYVRDVAKNNVVNAIKNCPNPWWLEWLNTQLYLAQYNDFPESEYLPGFIAGAQQAMEKARPRAHKANAKLTRQANKARRQQIDVEISQLVIKEYLTSAKWLAHQLEQFCGVAPTAKKARQ